MLINGWVREDTQITSGRLIHSELKRPGDGLDSRTHLSRRSRLALLAFSSGPVRGFAQWCIKHFDRILAAVFSWTRLMLVWPARKNKSLSISTGN
jgi:hypothetical protein